MNVKYCILGRTKYKEIWELQRQIHRNKQTNSKLPDVLLLTEHEHVYTLGKDGDKDHLLKKNNAEYFEIDRGGDITYHGPGQLICYPIFDLNNYYKDVHRFLRELEEVVIRTLKETGIEPKRDEPYTGVWVGEEKICAIGIKVSRWITMHGFALNVNSDLSYFNNIIPCGIFHKGVTSISKLLNREIDMDFIVDSILKNFKEVFKINAEKTDINELHKSIK